MTRQYPPLSKIINNGQIIATQTFKKIKTFFKEIVEQDHFEI
jgi:hypothetical protein